MWTGVRGGSKRRGVGSLILRGGGNTSAALQQDRSREMRCGRFGSRGRGNAAAAKLAWSTRGARKNVGRGDNGASEMVGIEEQTFAEEVDVWRARGYSEMSAQMISGLRRRWLECIICRATMGSEQGLWSCTSCNSIVHSACNACMNPVPPLVLSIGSSLCILASFHRHNWAFSDITDSQVHANGHVSQQREPC
jgi:hypothetical protein